MKKALSVVNSVAGAAVLTLATAVVTLLFLMFSTGGDEIVRREGLFGSLFFEVQEKSDGALGVTMGVANPTALIVIFFVFAIIMTMVQIAYRGLKQRREQLIEEMATN